MMKLKNTLLNSQWVKEGITKKYVKYFEMNEYQDMAHQNLWDAAKAVIIKQIIAGTSK